MTYHYDENLKKKKKYQLKMNNGTELVLLKEADILYDILYFVRYFKRDGRFLKKCSVWMNGKVLE